MVPVPTSWKQIGSVSNAIEQGQEANVRSRVRTEQMRCLKQIWGCKVTFLACEHFVVVDLHSAPPASWLLSL